MLNSFQQLYPPVVMLNSFQHLYPPVVMLNSFQHLYPPVVMLNSFQHLLGKTKKHKKQQKNKKRYGTEKSATRHP